MFLSSMIVTCISSFCSLTDLKKLRCTCTFLERNLTLRRVITQKTSSERLAKLSKSLGMLDPIHVLYYLDQQTDQVVIHEYDSIYWTSIPSENLKKEFLPENIINLEVSGTDGHEYYTFEYSGGDFSCVNILKNEKSKYFEPILKVEAPPIVSFRRLEDEE